MGLIKTAIQSAKGIFSDQWREFFVCESMTPDTLVVRGRRQSGRRNNRGDEGVITNGSVIAVHEGQAMMVVDQGEILDFCAEPGEYTWNAGEPTCLHGDLDAGLLASFESFKRRFTFGAETGRDQRVYYFNLKEIPGNKYGTPAPVPFRVVDAGIGLDMDVSVRCNGEYSYSIVDPILFYKNVCGNVEDAFPRSRLDSQLKSEFLTALQPAFARISDMGVRYSALPGHTMEMAQAMNTVLSAKWVASRGIKVVTVGINSVTASPEDEATIKELQKSAVFRSTGMAAAHLVQAQAEAMKTAAANSGGAAVGYYGMNMAQNAGGFQAGDLFRMNAQPSAPRQGWVCTCGSVNQGNFCPECGARKPAGAPTYRCDKCGFTPEDPRNPPRFCPVCGDRFTDEDRA